MGVRVVGVSFDPRPPQKAYDPGHPDADADGFVAFPNVSPVEEIVNLVSTARSFEANLAALNVTRQLVQGSIEIGRS
jgi:flagellar basal-body rod protein FlgC